MAFLLTNNYPVMNKQEILREVCPLSERDCFYVIERTKTHFDYPVHIHPEFELNYIANAKGAIRIVGDSISEIEDLELVLITNHNLEHTWLEGNCDCSPKRQMKEITIQFREDLFINNLFKDQFRSIKYMFQQAKSGLIFSRAKIEAIAPKLKILAEEKNSFYSILKLMDIMYELSLDTEAISLASTTFSQTNDISDSRRVKKVLGYMRKNFKEKIKLEDVASLVNMSEASFSRFIKKRTGKTFIDYLIDYRVGNASRILVDTTLTIGEVCYECGFNNLSNFNRLFKQKKGYTPKEFRDNYQKKNIVV